MKIALVSEFFYPTLGGVQEHLYNVALQYTKMGHTVRIVTPRIFTSEPFESWWPGDLPREVYLPVGRSLPFFVNGSRGRLCVGLGLGKQLRKLLTPENFDIVHLHAPLNGTLPILATHFSSTYTVGTFHTSFPGSKSLDLFKGLAQKQIDKLDRILGVSPMSIQSISKYFDIEAEILPNGIDTQRFKPRWETNTGKRKDLNDGRMNILYIGRPDPRNGLDTLIMAFGQLVKKQPNLRLLIAGGGDEMKRYKAMAQFLPPESVRFLGAVREERAEIYRSADMHIFGVEKAAFSITLLEGMASGLPIITTSFEGHRNHGEPGRHFVTTPFGDVEALASEMERLILHPQVRESLAREARARSLTFDWSLVAERLLEIYREVRGEGPKSTHSSVKQHFSVSLNA